MQTTAQLVSIMACFCDVVFVKEQGSQPSDLSAEIYYQRPALAGPWFGPIPPSAILQGAGMSQKRTPLHCESKINTTVGAVSFSAISVIVYMHTFVLRLFSRYQISKPCVFPADRSICSQAWKQHRAKSALFLASVGFVVESQAAALGLERPVPCRQSQARVSINALFNRLIQMIMNK